MKIWIQRKKPEVKLFFKMNWFFKNFIREHAWFDTWLREIEKIWFFKQQYQIFNLKKFITQLIYILKTYQWPLTEWPQSWLTHAVRLLPIQAVQCQLAINAIYTKLLNVAIDLSADQNSIQLSLLNTPLFVVLEAPPTKSFT